MPTLTPVGASATPGRVPVWRRPWVRRVAAFAVGALIAASCELWPVWSRPVCVKLAPFLETLLGG